MKSRSEIEKARCAIAEAAMSMDLGDVQLAVFSGMATALHWVCDDDTDIENGLQMLLDGVTPVHGGEPASESQIFARARIMIDDARQHRQN